MFVRVTCWTEFAGKTGTGEKLNKLSFKTAVMIPVSPRTAESSRIRCESGQNRNGLLRETRTAIRREPFTESYDIIPCKELGRYGTHSYTSTL